MDLIDEIGHFGMKTIDPGSGVRIILIGDQPPAEAAPITVWTPEGPVVMPSPAFAPQPGSIGQASGGSPSVGSFDSGQPSQPQFTLPHLKFDGYFDTPLMQGIRNLPETLGNWLFSEGKDDASGASGNSAGQTGKDSAVTPVSPEITDNEVRDKTKDEIRDLATQKGLVSDRKKADKWRDPITGKERLRIDPGHTDTRTGRPYDDPRAADDHVHVYDSSGKKMGDLQHPKNNPHFPVRKE